MHEIRRKERNLPVPLTEGEHHDRSVELAAVLEAKDALDAAIRAQKEAWKTERKELDARERVLRTAVISHDELRPVMCIELLSPERMRVEVVRLDTMASIESRQAQQTDMQALQSSLPLGAPVDGSHRPDH